MEIIVGGNRFEKYLHNAHWANIFQTYYHRRLFPYLYSRFCLYKSRKKFFLPIFTLLLSNCYKNIKCGAEFFSPNSIQAQPLTTIQILYLQQSILVSNDNARSIHPLEPYR